MRIRSFAARVALAALAFLFVCLPAAQGKTSATRSQGKAGQANVSAAEQKAAEAIDSAPDPAAKLQAGAAFIKKYPKSTLHSRVAQALANEIAAVKDATQKVSLAQEYQGIFKEPSDQELIVPILIDGYRDAKRFDEAFAAGTEFLKSNPDSLLVLVKLLMLGTDQAKQRNGKFIEPSLQYGAHAIQLIEAKKIPPGMDDAAWKVFETNLPRMYQSMGVLNLVKGDRVEARARLTKAAELAPTDPFNYLLLLDVVDSAYQEAAKRYQTMPSGNAKNEEYPKVMALLDNVIDILARVIALSEGNAQLAQARQQSINDLESYYKYRHNNSTEGMQQLIDKYKATAKP
jgi:tetratricopeptide (TPR) repeat protein